MADKALIGAAGEHLVLSRLLARGLLAAQAPRGARKVDILVNFPDGGEPCLVQVKTKTRGSAWPMNEKHEGIRDPDLFYCFVDLGPVDSLVYVLPARVVAAAIRKGHARWLATPRLDGGQHRDSVMRQIKPANWMNKYLENWDQLSERKRRIP